MSSYSIRDQLLSYSLSGDICKIFIKNMWDPKNIKNIKQLSEYIGVDEQQLDFFIKSEPIVFENYMKQNDEIYEKSWYIKMKIPKKRSFSYRVVYKIRLHILCELNKTLFYYLRKIYKPKDCVQGFVSKRNIRTNASIHINKKILLNLDIKDFFESIDYTCIKNIFIDIGFSEEISNILSKFTTIDNHLVLGFNTSPILSNLAVSDMDDDFLNLARKYNSDYTRYADDITFSSNKEIPDISEVEFILNKYKLKINPKKTKIMKSGRKQYVTGLTVSDKNYPRIPKWMKRKIRMELFYMKKYGIISHYCRINNIDYDDYDAEKLSGKYFDYKLRGLINYINSIEPYIAEKFRILYNEVSDNEKEVYGNWRFKIYRSYTDENDIYRKFKKIISEV